MVAYFFMAVLIALWMAWVLQALLSAWQWRLFAGRFVHEQESNTDKPQPTAAIIVPFKGVDLDMETTIARLCTLDYPAYELLLVVDSAQDPAYPLLQREIARHPHIPSQILIAGQAGMNEGQKVHNQLFAIDHLLARQGQPDQPEVWVFADSDAIPDPQWLANMVWPLFRRNVGMTTGYRWLEPVDRPGSSWLWSSIASVINSSVIGFFRNNDYSHAWGGSMALLARVAIEGDLRGHLTGALCDDYQFTRMIRRMGMRLYFVRYCLVATPVAFDRHSMMNFAHRQYLLTRVYAPKLFYGVLSIVSLYTLANLSAWAAMIALLMHYPGAWYFWGIPAITIVHVMFWNHIRATQRKLAARRALGDDAVRRMGRVWIIDRWFTWVWMLVHLVIILRSSYGRTMCWRGIYYRLYGPQKVERMNRS